MALRRGDGLRLQRRDTRVGHHVHRRRQSSVRVAGGRERPLADEGEHAEILMRDVFRVGDRAWPPIHGDHRCRAVQPVSRARVAARRIAHDFNREFRLDDLAIGRLRWPRQEHPEESPLEQQRMRLRVPSRQVRTVHAVHGREDRILSPRRAPSILNRGDRDRHRIGRLVTAHAGAAVAANRLEERMPLRLDGATRIQDAKLAMRIGIRHIRRQRRTIAGGPPSRRATSRGRRSCGRDLRRLLTGDQRPREKQKPLRRSATFSSEAD